MADVEEEEDQILGLLCDVLAAGAQQQKVTAPSPRESHNTWLHAHHEWRHQQSQSQINTYWIQLTPKADSHLFVGRTAKAIFSNLLFCAHFTYFCDSGSYIPHHTSVCAENLFLASAYGWTQSADLYSGLVFRGSHIIENQ